MITTLLNECSIPSARYEGYVWMSDSQQPLVLQGQEEYALTRSASTLPFVVEAQLYDRTLRTSYSLRWTDGRYLLYKHELGEHQEEAREERFLPHPRIAAQLPENARLHFLQDWVEQTDPLCEGMPVLTPGARVFVGFAPL